MERMETKKRELYRRCEEVDEVGEVWGLWL